MLDGLQAVCDHFAELLPQLEINLARLAVLRDVFLATDVRILNASFGELVVYGFWIITAILILGP